MSMRVPVNEPRITDAAKQYVADAMQTGWISSAGPCVEKFETAFAKYIGTKHAIFTTSGTAALHIALLSLDIGPGDEVIVPDFTMIASAFAVMYTGARPVFVDVEGDTYNINAEYIEQKITKNTKAIMPVHIYGLPCDMDPIMDIAKKHNIAIVEDAAEAHGATYKGKKCGSIGTINAFSFYGNKIITTGEGGMICTDDSTLAARARSLKDLAHDSTKRFRHLELGFNYRPTNLQAAIGLGQLEEIDSFLKKKEAMANMYEKHLSAIEGIRLPVARSYAKSVYWMYAILLEENFCCSRDDFTKQLKDMGVDTRDFFLPCHSQPAVCQRFPSKEKFPISEDIAKRGLYLPSGLAIRDEQIQYVCECIKKIA